MGPESLSNGSLQREMWASNLSCLDSMNFMFQRIGEGAWQMIQVASGASAAYDRAIAETQTIPSEGIP